MNHLVYTMKMSNESIIKCILVNGGERNKKSTLFKLLLYQS